MKRNLEKFVEIKHVTPVPNKILHINFQIMFLNIPILFFFRKHTTDGNRDLKRTSYSPTVWNINVS